MAEESHPQSDSAAEEVDLRTNSRGFEQTSAQPMSVAQLEFSDTDHKNEMSDSEPQVSEMNYLIPESSVKAVSSMTTPLSWTEENTLVEPQVAEIPAPAGTKTIPYFNEPTLYLQEDGKSKPTPDLQNRVQELEEKVQRLNAIIGSGHQEPATPSVRKQALVAESTPPATSPNGTQANPEKSTAVDLHRKLKVLNGKHFDDSSASRTWYAIEVLMDHRSKREHFRETSRYFAQSSNNTDETKILLQDLPSRVRIRSRALLSLLAGIDNSNLAYDNEKTMNVPGKASVVFLYPFKFFVTYERQIRNKIAEMIEEEEEETNRKVEIERSTKTTDENSKNKSEKDTASSTENLDGRVSSAMRKAADRIQRHCEEGKLLLQLFDGELKPVFDLRHRFEKGEVTMVAWEHLWLLFTIGGLAFQREPDIGHNPRLIRVVEFHGGRRKLHDDQPGHAEGHARQAKKTKKSVEKETPFYISAFYVDSDGGSFFPIQESFYIPHWDGLRHVRELKLFPIACCKQGEDRDFHQSSMDSWMHDLINRGKNFARLGSVAFKYFEGHAFGEDRELFDSPVVIDFALAKNEVKPTRPSRTLQYYKIESGTPHQLILTLGDMKEVMTRTEANRKGASIDDVNLDVIHNDILFDYELAQAQIPKLGPSSARFIDYKELERSHEQDYAIFNNFVWGFVLREGVWAKLDLYFLGEIETSRGLIDSLQLPEGHKNILMSTVQPRTQTSISSQLNLDLIQGKGKGVKIMLYGDPGVGKTCTAEAIADYTNRPLYRITVGSLGTSVASIEKHLSKIFRRGHRWGCIVLFDEADVFFLSRDKGDPYRNSIVSVFLNKLEYYSGILILTTNRAEAFDEAIMSRIPTVLYYPPLDLEATLNLFDHHFENILDFSRSAQDARSSDQARALTDLKIEIDKEAIRRWVATQVKGKKNGWWNGRQIQYGFRSAVALAESARKPYEARIKLTVKDFVQVANTYSDHQNRQQAFGQQQRSMGEKLLSLASSE